MKFEFFYKLIFENTVGKTLYHGTSKKNFDKSQSFDSLFLFGGGLNDDSNSFVNTMYNDIEEDERETPLFAADKTDFDKSVNAMLFHIAKNKNISFRDVTENDIRNDGIIFVFYDTNDSWNKYDPYSNTDYDSTYKGLETNDYFKEYDKPNGWYEGSKLLRILKRKGYKFPYRHK